MLLPGSKSISNRALLLALLSRRECVLEGLLESADTRAMLGCMEALGIPFKAMGGTVCLSAREALFPNPEASLFVDNAGTVARFLTAALCLAANGQYFLDGSEAMRRRPMAGLLQALSASGAVVVFEEEYGHFPFTLHAHGLTGGEMLCDAALSGQIVSALLMAATGAASPQTRLRLQGGTVSRPFIDMTLGMIRQFGGQAAVVDENTFEVRQGLPGCDRYVVEADATAASYFLALPLAVGGSLTIANFPQTGLQGDAAFRAVVAQLGVQSTDTPDGLKVCAAEAAAVPDNTELQLDFNAISDTFLTLAAVAPLLERPVVITGIEHTRHQETDRIAAMANELRKLGQQVSETAGSLTIHGSREAMRRATQDAPVSIATYDDHRVAMSFGILGCHDLHGDGRPWLSIENPECTGKTFPEFFNVLASCRPWPQGQSLQDAGLKD